MKQYLTVLVKEKMSISLSILAWGKSLTLSMRMCSFALANVAQIVGSRDAQCNAKEITFFGTLIAVCMVHIFFVKIPEMVNLQIFLVEFWYNAHLD